MALRISTRKTRDVFAPFDSLIHESVHQFHRHVVRYDMPQWLDEGLACYVSSISLGDGTFDPNFIQRDAYPLNHIPYLRLTGNIEEDIKKQSHNTVAGYINQWPSAEYETLNLIWCMFIGSVLFRFLIDGKQRKLPLEVIRFH